MNVIRQLRQLNPKRPVTTDEARSIAERQATRLLRLSGVREPDVPVEVIASLPRVRVELRERIPVSGSTHWADGSWLILVNADDAYVRRRFTLAHEIKHVIDHPIVDIAYPKEGDVTSEERQELICDYFAACLLMPRVWVKQHWINGLQNTTELAQIFGVSRAAMAYRLRDLGLVEPTFRRRKYFRTAPGAPSHRLRELVST